MKNIRRRLALVALVVTDYDAAIAYYTEVLGFELVVDEPLDDAGKRWVVVAPSASYEGCHLLLALADGDKQQSSVGRQAGGRVGFFLHTEDFASDFERMSRLGVVFEEAPRVEVYGTVAVFQDLYGNRWDLLQPNPLDKDSQ